MALEIEKIMSEFEAALTVVLEASFTPEGATADMRSTLAQARVSAQKARDAGHHKQYNAAVDRAFRSAINNFH